MKKHITVAALLAAGAAFANAATTLTYWGGNGNHDLLTIENDYTPYLTLTGSKRAPASVVDALKTKGNTTYDLTFSPTNDSNVYNPTFTLNDDIYLNSLTIGNSKPTSYTINFGETGSITTDQNINFGESATSITINVSLAANSLLGYENKTYERTLLTGNANYGIWNYFDRGPKLGAIDGLDEYECIGVTKNKSDIGAGQYGLFYSDSGTKDTVTLVVGVIPEPSAFGLLAGLGALALVGARRRRR